MKPCGDHTAKVEEEIAQASLLAPVELGSPVKVWDHAAHEWRIVQSPFMHFDNGNHLPPNIKVTRP